MDRRGEAWTERDRRDERDPDERDRSVAPPIEREHETYAGIFDEDERRERERQS